MVGTRGGVGRIAAMVIALVICLLLLFAGSARAARYLIVQCQFGAGLDADWGDTTGGAKFRADAYCGDGGAGDHVRTLTRDGAESVSGTRFARWRWLAPAGTYMTGINGVWWHALNDGMEQRFGAINWAGGFEPLFAANGTDTVQRFFALGFPVPVAGLEDRLLCAKGEANWCSLAASSWSSIRALTVELEDESAPTAEINGDLTWAMWHRGVGNLAIYGNDVGSGVRFGETLIDGARAALTEYPCAMVNVGGELRGAQMRPCLPLVNQNQAIATTAYTDGPHTIVHCAIDFAGARGCTAPLMVYIDNNPPVHPRPVTIAGGEGWHRANRFDLSWTDPDQGAASPIAGAYYRVTGSNGFDSGVNYVAGLGIAALSNIQVPGAGPWNLHLWLRDEAGNESAATGIDLPLRFDDQPPAVSFPNGEPDGDQSRAAGGNGGQVTASVGDGLSGPAAGTISYRRAEGTGWTDLPTKFHAEGPTQAILSAPMPALPAGTWVFRAEASDAAGNVAASSLHADGTQVSIQVTPGQAGGRGAGNGPGRDCRTRAAQRADVCAGVAGGGPSARRAKTRLFARLRGGHGKGDSLTVPFGGPALLAGRLTSAAGAGLAGHRIKVVSRPSHGALVPRAVELVTTGRRGGFVLRLGSGTSRRITVSFAGNDSLAPARHRSLDLRVRSGVTLAAAPAVLHTGQAVRLRGSVRTRSAPIPRRGKLIALQYLETETGRWRPVLVTRTDHDGRFHARYRFRYVSGAARIRLRATALAEERWPYAPGSSAPVTVTVEGR